MCQPSEWAGSPLIDFIASFLGVAGSKMVGDHIILILFDLENAICSRTMPHHIPCGWYREEQPKG